VAVSKFEKKRSI